MRMKNGPKHDASSFSLSLNFLVFHGTDLAKSKFRAHIQILNFKMQNYLTECLHGTDVIIIKTGNVNNYILIT